MAEGSAQESSVELVTLPSGRRGLMLDPKTLREAGVKAIVRERVTEHFKNDKLVRREIERERLEISSE